MSWEYHWCDQCERHMTRVGSFADDAGRVHVSFRCDGCGAEATIAEPEQSHLGRLDPPVP